MLTVFGKLIRGPTRLAQVLRGFAAAIVMASFFVVDPTVAQTVMPHDQLETLLDRRFGERPIARGLAQNGRLIEVFASADRATWTIVITTPQGLSRIGSAGSHWSDLTPGVGQYSSLARVGE